MLQISDLRFSYSRRQPPVLDGFSLSINAGGIYGLLGRNGAGKSTLLYLMAGLLKPQKGSVRFNGIETRRRLPSTLSDIFIVPEEFSLPPIKLGDYLRTNSHFYPNFSMDDMRRHLDTFELDADINLGQLSMGQKKKAYMCFALACNTPLLLLDEPTNGLDIPGKSRFRKFIVSSMTDDRTIVISTHQVRDIDRILDHIIITDSNRVLFDHTVVETLSRLRFLSTDSPRLKEEALYSQPSVNGAEIILPNDGEHETDLNLESLFELALQNPGLLASQFPTQK